MNPKIFLSTTIETPEVSLLVDTTAKTLGVHHEILRTRFVCGRFGLFHEKPVAPAYRRCTAIENRAARVTVLQGRIAAARGGVSADTNVPGMV
jgi:hypothetical protein